MGKFLDPCLGKRGWVWRTKIFLGWNINAFPFLILVSIFAQNAKTNQNKERKRIHISMKKTFLSSRPSHVFPSMGPGTYPCAHSGNRLVCFCQNPHLKMHVNQKSTSAYNKTTTFLALFWSILPRGVVKLSETRKGSALISQSKTHFQYKYNRKSWKNINFLDLAQIETDEVENLHTVRFKHAETENIN